MADTETRQIVSFLQEPNNHDVAAAVHRHWPEARVDFLGRFASRLAQRITEEIGERFGLECEHSVTGRDDKWQAMSLFRHGDAWRVGSETVKICLEAQSRGPQNWVIGVRGGKEGIRDTVKPLEEALGKQKTSPWWPWYEFVDQHWRWWYNITPALARETGVDGAATRYFLDRFREICDKAVPIIDDAVRRGRGEAES